MNNQELVKFLDECGICLICQLRYLKARGAEYKDAKKTFEKLNINFSEPRSVSPAHDEQNFKIPRLDVCRTCLGLFSAQFQQHLIDCISDVDISKFDCDKIGVAISLPILLQARQLSMWYSLLNKFGAVIDRGRAPDVPLKEAVKLIIIPKICEELKKAYDSENCLLIKIDLDHLQEIEEKAGLCELQKALFSSQNSKKTEVSRGFLEKHYKPNQISDDNFKKYIPVPPPAAVETLYLKSISLEGPTVFIAGRYRKITRKLSHTPWILNGERKMEESIQEIIINSIGAYFSTTPERAIFMSSGREDVDVRCLGKGRPFVVEIPNAYRTKLSKDLARTMELDIEESRKVSVCNLQVVQREELVHIKRGEEDKRKFYRALCQLKKPATVEMLNALHMPQGFEIKQKTPLRVLHRRPLHTRPRTVYSLKAFVPKENVNVLVLDIVSQAGTYIKELVHGEFGRTVPSIASIIGTSIDIIALDVVGIDLHWPNEVNNRE